MSWPGPGGLQVYRPDSYGPFAYYAYLPFAALFPTAPAVVATLLPALCFDALTLAGLLRLGRRLGGRPLARAFVFAYLLYPFPDLSLMAETNDALIAALCVWAIVAAAERPAARGLLMAAAALTKFLPALLALQFLGVARAPRYALTLVAALAAMLAWPLITSGPAAFLDSTFGYQLFQRGGGVQFSIWTYIPQRGVVARPARRRAGAARPVTDAPPGRAGPESGRRPRRRAPDRLAAAARLLVLQLPHLVLPAHRGRDHGGPAGRERPTGQRRVPSATTPAAAEGSAAVRLARERGCLLEADAVGVRRTGDG